jgi:hypothetical protein
LIFKYHWFFLIYYMRIEKDHRVVITKIGRLILREEKVFPHSLELFRASFLRSPFLSLARAVKVKNRESKQKVALTVVLHCWFIFFTHPRIYSSVLIKTHLLFVFIFFYVKPDWIYSRVDHWLLHATWTHIRLIPRRWCYYAMFCFS